MATFSMSTAESPLASNDAAVIVMSVSGAGKTTVERGLAKALRGKFLEGDDLHTDAARARMHSGKALTDEDRWPWLDRIGFRLAEGLAARRPTVVACSALKRAYCDRLRAATGPSLTFVSLAADPEAMRRRVDGRKTPYMPASLVDSQFAAIETPRDEPGWSKFSPTRNSPP